MRKSKKRAVKYAKRRIKLDDVFTRIIGIENMLDGMAGDIKSVLSKREASRTSLMGAIYRVEQLVTQINESQNQVLQQTLPSLSKNGKASEHDATTQT